MAKQPSANVALRLPPFSKADLTGLVSALKEKGEGANQHDLVGVLLRRAAASVHDAEAMATLGAEMRDQRAKARAVGY